MQCILPEEMARLVSSERYQNKNQKKNIFVFHRFCICIYYSLEIKDKKSKKRRVCRCGAEVEDNPNECNTPGFPIRTEPQLVQDLQGFDRPELPQNNRRIVA